jgi:YD repeat-containing protein
MAKRGQTVRRPPAGRRRPTKTKISSPKIKSEIGNADLKRELAKARRELTEARQQQTATSEVLRVISSSPGELQRVFNATLENATRTCAAKFGILYQCEGDALRTVAIHGAPQSFVEERQHNPIVSPNPDTTLGRALSTKQPVQINTTTFRDSVGRTTHRAVTSGNTTTNYDGGGQSIGRATTNGNTTTFRDSGGRTTGRATTNGNMTTTYDASGKLISRETTTGNTTTVYDASGRNVGGFTSNR